jgi:hypothetical protein
MASRQWSCPGREPRPAAVEAETVRKPKTRVSLWHTDVDGIGTKKATKSSSATSTILLRTGFVFRFPAAILATGFGILSAWSLTCGFILGTVTRGRRSALLPAYFSIPRWEGSKDSLAE